MTIAASWTAAPAMRRAPVLLGNTTKFNDEVLIAANFDVDVRVIASAGADFESTYTSYTETAESRASADPTFTIDEPGYSANTIEGVPAGPADGAPEPATGRDAARFRRAGFHGPQQGEEQRPFGGLITRESHSIPSGLEVASGRPRIPQQALYCAKKPPSTASVCPVIIAAAGLTRKAIAAAMSAGSASFFKGVIASIRATSSGSLRIGPISSVRT